MTTNASATKAELEEGARLTSTAKAALGISIDSLSLSGRGVDRVLRVARTVADLEGATEISNEHVSEAVSYRDADAEAVMSA